MPTEISPLASQVSAVGYTLIRKSIPKRIWKHIQTVKIYMQLESFFAVDMSLFSMERDKYLQCWPMRLISDCRNGGFRLLIMSHMRRPSDIFDNLVCHSFLYHMEYSLLLYTFVWRYLLCFKFYIPHSYLGVRLQQSSFGSSNRNRHLSFHTTDTLIEDQCTTKPCRTKVLENSSSHG